MSDAVSFTDLDGQHVELLPARTVLSMFSAGDGGVASDGTNGQGTIGGNILGMPMPIFGQGNGVGTNGGSADG
ncbi:MAG: hypothetical protein M3228_08885 [Actinomycetota bacterium]|nr:hypothetical protein [Actinomycetota bacterium]